MGEFHSSKKLLIKMTEGIGIEGSVKCRCRQFWSRWPFSKFVQDVTAEGLGKGVRWVRGQCAQEECVSWDV